MSKEVRVLLLEDEEAHAELIAMAFSRSGEPNTLVHATSLAEAVSALDEQQPDIIIADWMLPDGKGLDLLEASPIAKKCPFVIMTSHGSEQVAVDAMKAGALDYIVKSPMAFEQMPHAAQRSIREWRHIQERGFAEEKYRSIVEGAPVGILSVSMDGEVLAANPALATMYGYDSLVDGLEHLQTVADHYADPTDRDRLLAEIVKNGSVQDYEMEHLRKDGSTLWVSYTASAARDIKGEIVSIEGFVTDVTERKLSDDRLKDYYNQLESEVLDRTKELEESRQQFSDIIEFLPDATFVVDREGKVVAWNHAMAELTGVPKSRVLGKSDYEYAIHLYGVRKPVLIDLILSGKAQNVHGPMKGGDSTFRVETSLERLRGGKGAFVAIKASPLFDKQGEIVGAIESVRDITQRKEAELAVKEQLAFIQALIDIIPSAIFYRDSNDRVTLCNKAFESFTSLLRADVVGSLVEDVFPAQSLDRQRKYEQQLSENDMVVYERHGESVPGPIKDAMVHKAAHRNSDGKVLGVVTVATDITDRKRMEDELIKAKEIAEAANSAKSRFLATMSHEIRTPMNAIMGLTDITLQQPLSDAQRENLTAVMDSARHLLAVINDILDYSKIEADKLVLEKAPFTLGEVLDPMRHTFAPQVDQQSVTLAIDVKPGIPAALKGDSFRLRQVLINLVGNAIKFTEGGEVKLSARPVEVDSEQALVEFSVSDSGIGIAADKLAVIFESFSQAEGDTTRRYGGTGLGLSISARLVEMMGGILQVESEEGRGSRFLFTVPFGICELLVEAADPADLDVGSGLRVLVAEDNELNAKVAVQFFDRMGHTAQATGDGWDAIEMLEQDDFDMVFMDLEMPTMDGLEATRRIRLGEAGEANRDIPIVAMTAHALSEVRDSCLNAGMDHFAIKPIEYAKLREAVAAVLHLVKGGAALDPTKKKLCSKIATEADKQISTKGTKQSFKGSSEQVDERLIGLEDLAILDWQDFMDDLDGNQELLDGFYDDFKASLPEIAKNLEAALAAEDVAEAVRLAHALKGSAGTARAGRVSRVAQELESAGQEHGLASMLVFLPAFRTQSDLAMQALDARDWQQG